MTTNHDGHICGNRAINDLLIIAQMECNDPNIDISFTGLSYVKF